MEWRATFDTPKNALSAELFLNRALFDEQQVMVSFEGDRNLIISNIPYYWVKDEIEPEYTKRGLVSIKPIFRLEYGTNLFGTIWPSGLFSDVSLDVAGRRFNVHRAILSSISPYFLALFTQMREADQPGIQLRDVDPVVFSHLLDLIYGHRMEIRSLETLRLLLLAQYLQINMIPLDEILDQIRIEEEDLLEYIDLMSRLNSGVYPLQYTEVLFEKILPNFETPIEEIVPLLPVELQQEYNSVYK